MGIDISGHISEHVDQFSGEAFDLVLTLCDSAREACPIFPGAKNVQHRAFTDLAHCELGEDEIYEPFERVRDETGIYCRDLLIPEPGR